VVLTVNVAAPLPATEIGTNAHAGGGVTVGEMLLQERFTVPLKLLSAAIVIVEVADPPGMTLAGDKAEAEILKSCTARLSAVSWITDPEVPLTVTLEVPTGVVAEVETVRAEVTGAAPGITEGGTKEQFASVGRPTGQVSVTALLNPFSPLTEIV
jgi:hypothetical protein